MPDGELFTGMVWREAYYRENGPEGNMAPAAEGAGCTIFVADSVI
jgi:hypothetical protein